MLFRLSTAGNSRKTVHRWNHKVNTAYRSVIAKSRLLDVDGPYFDLVLLCREIVETALQTQQAYRLSLLIPRTEFNRGYVALLILNCWSTVLVHSFPMRTGRRRLLALVCDCILGMVTTVGISALILSIYSRDFDFELTQFPPNIWYQDVWVVHAMSEFQMLLVTSWADLILRMLLL